MRRTAKQIANDAHRALWCVLDVGSLKVSVYLVDRDRFADHMTEDGVPLVGVWLPEPSMILIGWDLEHDHAEHILVHEMTHAALYSAGHDPNNEKQINTHAAVLFEALKRNGMLRIPPRPVTPEDRRRVKESRK